MKRSCVVVLCGCLAVAAIADEIELPKAPEGYSWVRAKTPRAAFLKPAGWHYRVLGDL